MKENNHAYAAYVRARTTVKMCHEVLVPHPQIRKVNPNAKKSEHPCTFPNCPTSNLLISLTALKHAGHHAYFSSLPVPRHHPLGTGVYWTEEGIDHHRRNSGAHESG